MTIRKAPEALARLAAHGLPGAPEEPIEAESLHQLLALADSRRVLAQLAAAVRAGLVANADDEFRAGLDDRLRTAVAMTMGAHAAAVEVVERLHAAGVAGIRVLKGCATGHLDHARPIDRFTTDVDLLIRIDDHDRAVAAFPDDAVPPTRGERWQRRYGKAITVHGSLGVDVDIHVMLAAGYFGLVMPADELFATTEPFTVNGVEMEALDGPNRLLHAALHVGYSKFTNLNSALDVPQLVLVSGVDWAEAMERAYGWGVDGLFARGVAQAWSRFELPDHPLVDWAETHVPSRRQRLAFRVAASHPESNLLTAPLALPPWKWPGYVLPFLFPTQGFLQMKGRTRTEQFTRIFRRMATRT